MIIEKLEELKGRIKKKRVILTFNDGTTTKGWNIHLDGDESPLPWSIFRSEGRDYYSFYLNNETAASLDVHKLHISEVSIASAFAAYLSPGIDWNSYTIVNRVHNNITIKAAVLNQENKSKFMSRIREMQEHLKGDLTI